MNNNCNNDNVSMSSGIVAINKPKGWTSFDVVNKLKRKFRPLKVGHLGTLDPMATGILLITVGKATKLFDLMQTKNKTYVAEFTFGYATDTLDATGKTILETNDYPSITDIKNVLNSFVGDIDQIPPLFSAKSINGERAYSLARKGIDFELKPKRVHIESIDFISYNRHILKLRICCGSGTYIRSICRDIAEKVNSVATMTSLERTSIDKFRLKDCQEITDKEFVVRPINNLLSYPTLNLCETEEFKILNGQTLNLNEKDGFYLLGAENVKAIVEIKESVAKMRICLI